MTDPVAVVAECCERFQSGEVPWELLAEDIEWEISEMLDQTGTFHGHDGIRSFLREWLGTWDDYSFEVEDIVAGAGGRVLVLFRERGRGKGSGVEVELRPGGVWTVAGGEVIRYRGYVDRDEAARAAGVAPQPE